MTRAQMKVQINQDAYDAAYERRKFRKECVTQGIVEFVREYNYYEMKYRGRFICYISGRSEENLKLMAVWHVIKIAEDNR